MIDWRDLPEDVRAVLMRRSMPDYVEWEKQVRATGACAQPIRLSGVRNVIDAATGEVLDAYSTDHEPLGYLMIPCRNRRAAVCPSCSQVYRHDTYQLVSTGLAGGKGVPETVAEHPAVFATLTAPSFGAVHSRRRQVAADGRPVPCRIRRDAEPCPHGVLMCCRERHDEGDRRVGQAFCLDCYDYPGAVLFNAYAGELWRRVVIYMWREVASRTGCSRATLNDIARLSFAKVAEYQARGVVHFHAVIRIDGPDGPTSAPPAWSSVELLDKCFRAAVNAVQLDVPDPEEPEQLIRTLRFGSQVDTRPIYRDEVDVVDGALSSRRVARYVAKYVTKAAETTGTLSRRVARLADLDGLHLPAHTERMIRACFALDAIPAYGDIQFRRWAHMLGYRGHCATKSRAYSTTYRRLRDERRVHRDAERRLRDGLPPRDERAVIVEGEWRFLRAGLGYGERAIVEAIRRQMAVGRCVREVSDAESGR